MLHSKTEIILPNRIGDAILSLPMLICLKQLQSKFGSADEEIVIYPPFNLFEIIWSLKIFETATLDEIIKVHSWFAPAKQSFILDTSSRILGLRSQTVYGEKIKAKWFTKFYTQDLPFLPLEKTASHLPSELIEFLKNSFNLPLASIRYFGVLLKLNYSVAQIKQVFSFDCKNILNLQTDLNYWEPKLAQNNYIVICMEAAYGRKHENKRRLPENYYLEISQKLYENHGLLSVFIGVEHKPKILPNSFSLDLRGKLSLLQLAQLLKFSKAYLGNDTGPLHLANLLKTESFCIYLSTSPEIYGPIFPQFNHPINNPQSVSEILEIIKTKLQLN